MVHLKSRFPVPGTRRRCLETLLVVEDEETVLAMVRGQLEEAGYTVLATTSPEHAVELAAGYQGTIHLLVTDLIMPCMNGRELARALAAARPGLKCLYMSGRAPSGAVLRATVLRTKPPT
jgi:CheY-like chemotaxis protein